MNFISKVGMAFQSNEAGLFTGAATSQFPSKSAKVLVATSSMMPTNGVLTISNESSSKFNCNKFSHRSNLTISGKDIIYTNSTNRTSSNPRAIAVDNNTVILQTAVTSSYGHQPTVIVQAPPPATSQILELVSSASATNTVISRVCTTDSGTIITSSSGNAHVPLLVTPSPITAVKRSAEPTVTNVAVSEPSSTTATENSTAIKTEDPNSKRQRVEEASS